MKKLILILVAMMMAVTSLMASVSKANLFDREPKKANEVFCALAGGVISGAIVKNVSGKDLPTFFAALIGGAIGYHFCKELNNAEKRALDDMLNQGLDEVFHAPRRVILNPIELAFHGIMEIDQAGIRKRDDAQCFRFQAAVYRRALMGEVSRGQDTFMGRTDTYWTCKNPETLEWEIFNSGSGIKVVDTRVKSRESQSGNGSISVTAARVTREQISRWTALNPSTAQSYFKTAPVGVSTKTGAQGQRLHVINNLFEMGEFAGLGVTRDGALGVKMGNKDYGYIASDFGVECDLLMPGMNAPFCESFEVRNFHFQGMILNGTAKFIYTNGDMIVFDDINGKYRVNIRQLVP